MIEPTFANLTSIALRRWRFFSVTAVLIAGAGAGYLVFTTPQYRSEASIVVRFDDKSLLETNLAKDSTATVTAQNDRHETVLAHADILKSPDLARSVIDQIGLGTVFPEIVADPPSRGTPEDEALYQFGKKLVIEPDQQGDVIAISYDNPDPDVAQRVLHDLIANYMHKEAEIFAHPSVVFETAQVEDAAARLKEAQSRLQQFKADNGITSFDEQMSGLIRQRGDISESLQSAQVAFANASNRRDELRRLVKTVPESVANSASGEKYRAADDAQATLDGLQLKEHQLLTTYRSDSPVLNQLRAQIAAATADVATRRSAIASRDASAPNLVFQNIQTDLLRATAEAAGAAQNVDVLSRQEASLDARLATLEQRHAELLDRVRAVDLCDNAYRALSLHLVDARVDDGRLQDRISHDAVITQPSLPYKPAKPRYLIMSGAFAAAAALAGCCAMLLAELLDDSLNEQDQVTRTLGIPVLAIFDERPGRSRPSIAFSGHGLDPAATRQSAYAQGTGA